MSDQSHSNNKGGQTTGIVVAMPREMKTLGHWKVSGDGCVRHSEQVIICLSGIGKGKSVQAAEKLVNKGANCLLSWGTAAALSPDIAPGSIVIPEKIITENEGIIYTNKQLRNAFIDQLPYHDHIQNASLCETSKLLWSKEQKSTLFKSTSAEIADMESGAVALVAKKHHIPFIAIRSVSDSSEMTIPDSVHANLEGGTAHISRIVIQAIFTPKDWLPMLKLSYNFSKAQKALRRMAKVLLPALMNHNVTK
jgi:adenosylhomocysteine nucleosidase